MNLELRRERKEKKGTPREEDFMLLLLSFSYFSNRSHPSGDQTSPFSGPEHFLIAPGDSATTKF